MNRDVPANMECGGMAPLWLRAERAHSSITPKGWKRLNGLMHALEHYPMFPHLNLELLCLGALRAQPKRRHAAALQSRDFAGAIRNGAFS